MFTVESVETTRARWGTQWVANIRRANDVTLYRIGPAYSVAELLQRVLDQFATTSAASAARKGTARA